jgi:hypothetical protein
MRNVGGLQNKSPPLRGDDNHKNSGRAFNFAELTFKWRGR